METTDCSKTKILIMIGIKERPNTKELLSRKGVQTDVTCALCGLEGETHAHLFVKYVWLRSLWGSLKHRFGIHNEPEDSLNLWSFWRHTNVPLRKQEDCDVYMAALIWSVLTERNYGIFQHKTTIAFVHFG